MPAEEQELLARFLWNDLDIESGLHFAALRKKKSRAGSPFPRIRRNRRIRGNGLSVTTDRTCQIGAVVLLAGRISQATTLGRTLSAVGGGCILKYEGPIRATLELEVETTRIRRHA